MADNTTDSMRDFFERIRDERMMHANTATRIGNAFLMLLNYLLDSDTPFLRKDGEDTTEYLLTLLAGAVIGEAGSIRLNPDGSISCGSIKVNGSAVFQELVFNHQNVLEGDTYFSDRGIVEEVQPLSDGRFRLVMRRQYDDEKIPFHRYDVLKGSMNRLDSGRTFMETWLRVDAVDDAENSMDVTLYDNEDVPGGVNFAPMQSARLVRWGNQKDRDRQNVFFVSATDGRFLFMQGVTQPKVTDSNRAAFVGLPPDMDCLKGLPIDKRQPYVYARGLIVQDIIRIDYQGNPEYTPRDLGTWSPDKVYIHGWDETARGWFTDRVWWGGCFWQCAVGKATVGKEPRFNNADWVCLIGAQNMTLDIYSTEGDSFPAGKHWTTTLVAELWNAEMLVTEDEIPPEAICWTRLSGDDNADRAWNLKHGAGTVGMRLDIDSLKDVGVWKAGTKVGFQCEITLEKLKLNLVKSYSIIM